MEQNDKYAADAERGGELARFFRQRMSDLGWDKKSQLRFSEFCGLSQMTVSRLHRAIPTSTSFRAMVMYSLALDVPIDRLIEMLGLDEVVKGHMQDSRYSHLFRDTRYLLEYQSPMDQLLSSVPEEKKQLAANLIKNIVDNFSK